MDQPATTGISCESPVPRECSTLRHLGVILDGNRRWAATHDCDTSAAYRRGGERVLDLLGWCEEISTLEAVTLWPLSVDNLRRKPSQLEGLFEVIVDTSAAIAATGHWRINFLRHSASAAAHAEPCIAINRRTHPQDHRAHSQYCRRVHWPRRDSSSRKKAHRRPLQRGYDRSSPSGFAS